MSRGVGPVASKPEDQFKAGVAYGKMYAMPPWTALGIWWGLYIGMIEKMYAKH